MNYAERLRDKISEVYPQNQVNVSNFPTEAKCNGKFLLCLKVEFNGVTKSKTFLMFGENQEQSEIDRIFQTFIKQHWAHF